MSRRIIRPTIRWPANARFPLAEPRGSVCDRRDEFMRIVRAVLVLVALLVITRAAAYLVYVYEGLPTPGEVGDLESKLVHLAWRVQAGVRLYPPWRDYPHVTNFFSPGYFLVVGRIGSACGAGLEGLFVIGRAVTVACAPGHGARPGMGRAARSTASAPASSAATASLGAAPMIGAGLMVRPDTMAELLGIAGFFLALGRHREVAGRRPRPARRLDPDQADRRVLPRRRVACRCCIAGRRRDAATLLAGVVAGRRRRGRRGVGVRADVRLVAAGRGKDALEPRQLGRPAPRAGRLGPRPVRRAGDRRRGSGSPTRPRQATPIVLWLVVLGTGLVTAAKVGSGLNYFLSLRVVEALAIGTLWGAARHARGTHRRRLAARGDPGGRIPRAGHDPRRPDTPGGRGPRRRFYDGPRGSGSCSRTRQLFRLAEDPRVRLLTDSGLLQLHQKERAAFVDPFQFRLLVDSGQVRPDVILQRHPGRDRTTW